MMVGPGELNRYLKVTIPALLDFCDAVAVRCEDERVLVLRASPDFFQHEGRARNELWQWTLDARPSHVLSIDADELVSDGQALREACESQCPILTMELLEVWDASREVLGVRVDGGWRPHNAPLCFAVPGRLDSSWRIRDRALACGREPEAIRELYRRQCHEPSGVHLLHFGWANVEERAERYERYRVADGGRFHAGSHLASIMWPTGRVKLDERSWPSGVVPYRDALLARAVPTSGWAA